MQYPSYTAMGSAIYPKLFGSYESELFPVIEKTLQTHYKTVVDVGCAEGYYAVGFALKHQTAKVYAYDINPQALEQCKKMATLNGVTAKMVFDSNCTPQTLQTFNFSEKSLIICDCEGYELELFNDANLTNLKNCDVIIELHDLYNEEVSYRLHQLFSKTHQLEYIYSENTFKRLQKLGLEEQFSSNEIKTFFTERNGIMQWVFVTPK
jgi:tRNA G37 N-methylase Trm5